MCKKRLSNDFTLPLELVPEYDPNRTCSAHGNKFKAESCFLRVCSDQVTLYEDTKETIFNSKVYYRETEGPCKCRDNYNGHEYLMFHMGFGKMFCYFTLQNYLYGWATSGLSAYAAFRTIQNNVNSTGQNSTLYNQL